MKKRRQNCRLRQGYSLVRDPWSSRSRKRFFLLANLLAWAIYVPVLCVWMNIYSPGIFGFPRLAILVLVTFLITPAIVRLMLVHTPGYFFLTKLRYSEDVARQVSLLMYRRLSPQGSSAASDWGNLVWRRSSRQSTPARLCIRTDWDAWVFVGARLLGARTLEPRRSSLARVDVTPKGVRLLAGYVWPGVVLEVPTSAIVGVWSGSELPTIGGGNVFVLAVASDEDQILLPFRVHQWREDGVRSENVRELIARVQDVWGVTRNAPLPIPHIRPRRRST